MRRRSLLTQGSKDLPLDSISPADSVAGDYCFYDKTADKVIIVDQTKWSADKYPSDKCTPIGVVVVPGTHNVYGDGSCGVMSLKSMDCDTPSTGGTFEQGMNWGVFGTDVLTLSNLRYVPTGNTSDGIPTSDDTYGYLPSDKFDRSQCAHDADAFYYASPSIPSPYLTDGSRNPGYYQTSSPSSSNNALADFDGIGNTEKIIAQRGTKDYNSWGPVSNSGADYPAASCCDMFYTEGTSQGDWYLPACGELGYIMPSFNKINNAMTQLYVLQDPSLGVTLGTNRVYWSSTEYSGSHARCIYTYNGSVQNNRRKDDDYYVRAFLRVKDSTN